MPKVGKSVDLPDGACTGHEARNRPRDLFQSHVLTAQVAPLFALFLDWEPPLRECCSQRVRGLMLTVPCSASVGIEQPRAPLHRFASPRA